MFNNILLIIYVLVCACFTYAYTGQTIITVQNVPITFNLTSIESVLSNLNSILSTYENNNYSDISNNATIALKTLLYSCILTTILLCVGIIISYFGLVYISKILFGIALTIMIGICTALTIFIKSNTLMNLLPSSLSAIISNLTITYGNGFALMSASTSVMLVLNIIYSFLA